MNSVQESKNELEAAIRYAENAISSAKQTIESMEFRQEMAKKQYSEQTGREKELEREVAELKTQLVEERNRSMSYTNELEKLRSELHGLLVYRDLEEARGRAEGEVELLQRTISDIEAENAKLREDKERLTALEVQLRDKIRELKAQVKQ